MKRQQRNFFIIIAILAILAIIGLATLPAHAVEFDNLTYEFKTGLALYTDEHLDNGWEAELKVGTEDLEKYLFLSLLVADFKWGAQPLSVNRIVGFGIGMTREVTSGISAYGQIGYYWPFVEEAPSIREAMRNYTAEQYAAIYSSYYKFYWPNHQFKVQPNFGGKLGLTSRWNLTENLLLTADLGYRLLSLRHVYEYSDPEEKAKDPDSQLCWGQDHDYGGFTIAAGLQYSF